jgi:hypothetical protein
MLKIKDGVCLVSLSKEVLLLLEFDDSSAKAGVCKKSAKVECGVARISRQHGTPFDAVFVRALHVMQTSAC